MIQNNPSTLHSIGLYSLDVGIELDAGCDDVGTELEVATDGVIGSSDELGLELDDSTGITLGALGSMIHVLYVYGSLCSPLHLVRGAHGLNPL